MRLGTNPRELEEMCDLIHDLCGISLSSSKSYLLESRLSELLGKNQCSNYSDLCVKARDPSQHALRRELVNRMTTNETLFFRDSAPFNALQYKLIPEMIDAKEQLHRQKCLRVWSAGCSTGQEAYSAAMVLRELLEEYPSWDIKIVGTDISSDVVQQASRGHFDATAVDRGLPMHFRNKYFDREGDGWRANSLLRSMVQFRQANLLEPFNAIGSFDVIFCRNVAIYFNQENRVSLFRRFLKHLTSEGILIVGSAEAWGDLKDMYRPESHCHATIYRPLQVAAAR